MHPVCLRFPPRLSLPPLSLPSASTGLFTRRIKVRRHRDCLEILPVPDEKGPANILDPANRETRYVQVAAEFTPGRLHEPWTGVIDETYEAKDPRRCCSASGVQPCTYFVSDDAGDRLVRPELTLGVLHRAHALHPLIVQSSRTRAGSSFHRPGRTMFLLWEK